MSEESVVRDLFDRWERVWHEGQYDLVAECVAQVYTRHDESGTRRVTPEEYAAEIAAGRRERPNTRFIVYDHEIAGDRAWFRFTLMWTDPSTRETRTRAGMGGYAALPGRGRQARGDLALAAQPGLGMARRRWAGALDEQARITKRGIGRLRNPGGSIAATRTAARSPMAFVSNRMSSARARPEQLFHAYRILYRGLRHGGGAPPVPFAKARVGIDEIGCFLLCLGVG